jgi:hypothetical protein
MDAFESIGNCNVGTLSGSINDPIFSGLDVKQRKHVQQLYREARM